jgi:hypothetical protein
MILRSAFQTALLCSFVLSAGCASLNFKWEPVAFDSPEAVLDIKPLEPNTAEKDGVLLRLLPQAREIQAQDHLKVYSRLKEENGLRLDLRQSIRITHQPVAGKDSFRQRTETVFDGEAGRITEELEISTRGEILRFVEGFHESKVGKFKVVNASRTPMFPEEKVKMGDKWRYQEKMDARLESFLIKEKDPTPYDRQAESELTGFASVDGRRCAVIKTVSTQQKTTTVKVLFKTITAEIKASIEETTYLDYAQGVVAAKVTRTRSHSVFPGTDLEDRGLSQSIYQITETKT